MVRRSKPHPRHPLPLLPKHVQDRLTVLLDSCVAHARDLLQSGFGRCPRLDHSGQLFIREDGVNRHRLRLGDLLPKVAKSGEDGEVVRLE
ncbi:hypothetical protein V5E97_29450 [Singulisphaera sp. Ch08]|uniref:Uncharacterized protein n=1 Tax=Singulisphaera sp. Ch08 TaxID=3120278 RepID=A0AAU7CBA6_9BACT